MTNSVVFAVLILMGVPLGGPPVIRGAEGDCGQPMSTGSAPTATDALFVLRAAVGAATCVPCLCDVDNSGGARPVSATDALKVLSRAVGLPIVMNCPSCGSCYDELAPTCNGTCPVGLTCAPDPFDEGVCECLTECELGVPATCGGSCEVADGPPGRVCMTYGVSVAGVPIREGCVCAPPDTKVCAYASAPTCAGICPPGRVCTPGGGSGCVCEAQPLQPACAAAQSPTCGGTCDDGFLCEADGGSCRCVPFIKQAETCWDADAPICGGACSSGKLCAVDMGSDCQCFNRCELSDAPACGGTCLDSGKTCGVYTIHLGTMSLDYCYCM